MEAQLDELAVLLKKPSATDLMKQVLQYITACCKELNKVLKAERSITKDNSQKIVVAALNLHEVTSTEKPDPTKVREAWVQYLNCPLWIIHGQVYTIQSLLRFRNQDHQLSAIYDRLDQLSSSTK